MACIELYATGKKNSLSHRKAKIWLSKQTLKCCNLIGLQTSCSGTNPGIVMLPNLPLFRVEVGLRQTRDIQEVCRSNRILTALVL